MCDIYDKTAALLSRLRCIRSEAAHSNDEDIGTVLSDIENSIVLENTNMELGIEVWEALAYDLALAMVDEETIANEYGITLDYLAALKNNVFFMKMYNNKCEEVRSLGVDADFKVKMRMIASRALPQLMKRLTSERTATKDFHGLFKTVIELADLVPEESNTSSGLVSGTSVVFNISGVPGLEHLSKPLEIIEHVEKEEVING